MSIIVELSNIVHDYIVQYPDEYKQHIIEYIRENYNSIHNKLHQLRADYDEEDLQKDNLLIDIDTRELGGSALDSLIIRVNLSRDEVQDSFSYMLACKLCEFIGKHRQYRKDEIEQEEHTTEINGEKYIVKVYYHRFIYDIDPSTGKAIHRRHDWSMCVEPADDDDKCYYIYMWFNEDADYMDITCDLIPDL